MAPTTKNISKTRCIDNTYNNNEFKEDQSTTRKYNSDLIEKISYQFIIDACKTGNISMIKTYLNFGHEINESLTTGWSLLFYVASYAQPKVIQYLLYLGGDPNLHQDGYTPLMALCNSIKGSANKRIECLKYLIEGKVDVNAANKFKETSFMYACKIQEIDFVVELLKYIRHVNFADNKQRTALFYAVTNNRYDITKILIENGADISWTDCEGISAYDIALTKRYDKLIPLLTINCNNQQKRIETNYVCCWIDMFPIMKEINKDYIDSDIMNLLYGMGLENYESYFNGIDLKTFLRLKEEDIEKLGIDINVHRKRFTEGLFRFHKHTWKNNLLKVHKSESNITIEALTMLGNINKELSIISSSIYFSKNYLDSIQENEDKQKLRTEIKNMKTLALKLKSEINQIKNLVEVKKEQSDLSLPIYIQKNIIKTNYKWLIIAIITTASIYCFKIKDI